jgi:release factor glutamine methyltransferase
VGESFSWAELQREAERRIRRNPWVEARGSGEAESWNLLLCAFARASGGFTRSRPVSRTELWGMSGEKAPFEVIRQVLTWADARGAGAVLQHLTREQYFYEHDFEVGPEVLVPRPETEVLLSLAIEELSRGAPPLRGFEVGLGSGILSIELLHRFPGLKMEATERSPAAAQLARKNALRILGHVRSADLEVLEVAEGTRILEPFSGRADFFISNPPYLAEGSESELDAEVLAHEPRLALFPERELSSSGSLDPLVFYRRFAAGLPGLMNKNAPIFLELAAERASETLALFKSASWRDARLELDLTGKPRFLVAWLASP